MHQQLQACSTSAAAQGNLRLLMNALMNNSITCERSGLGAQFFAWRFIEVVLYMGLVHNTSGGAKILTKCFLTRSEKVGFLLLKADLEQTTAEIRKTNYQFLYKISRAS